VLCFGLFGTAQRSRPLIPLTPHRAAATAVHRSHDAMPVRARLVRGTAAVALRAGALQPFVRRRVHLLRATGPATPATDGIDEHIAALLGRPRVVLAASFGPPRPNWKAVLQVLAPDGSTIAWVKIGANPVTRELVRAEARFLAQAAALPLRRLQVAEVLHTGAWRDLELLVSTPLPRARRYRSVHDLSALVAPLSELQALFGGVREPLGDSRFWRELLDRACALPSGPGRELVTTAMSALAPRHARRELAFGRWHGDWSPWNMRQLHQRLAVWDWERSREPVPVGFDLLHHAVQTARWADRRPPAAAATAAVRTAAPALEELGVPSNDHRLVLALYLLELVLRDLEDVALLEGGAAAAPVLAPALRRVLEEGT
jgi:hypothetical protein